MFPRRGRWRKRAARPPGEVRYPFQSVNTPASEAIWVGASATDFSLACTKAARALLAGGEGPWGFVKLEGIVSLAPLLEGMREALERLRGLPILLAGGPDAEAWLEERTHGDPLGPRGLLTLLDLGDASAEDLPRWANYVGRFVVVGRRLASSQRELIALKRFLPPDRVPAFLMVG